MNDDEDMLARLANAEPMMRANGWHRSADAINRAQLVIRQQAEDIAMLERQLAALGRAGDREELLELRTRLKSGEYDGTDIMKAWIALDALIATRPA